MSSFFSKNLSGLTPYTPGEQPKDTRYIKLNTNESPYPPSQKAAALAAQAARRLQLYPDPACSALSQALAEAYGLREAQILLGNGSDEILFFAFSAFCDSENGAVFPAVSYGFYEVVAQLCRIPFSKIPLKEDFTVNCGDYCGVGRTVFLANPNAPTGIFLPLAEIEKIVASNRENVVVIDEAYIDFGGESAVSLIDKYDNLLVVQTFSKSRSMAGARLGMAFGSPALIKDLNTVKYSLNPYNINAMTMAAGIGTLQDSAYIRECCRRIVETRAYTVEKLKKLGFVCTDSCANFVFAKHPAISGQSVYAKLRQRGILVRHFDTPEIREYNRITVGTKDQMDALLAALEAIWEEET